MPKKIKTGSCVDKRCLFPVSCSQLKIEHQKQIELLRKIRQVKGVKKVFIASGIRYDMVIDDLRYGMKYLRELIQYYISGQLKIAPEHTEKIVLQKMGKPEKAYLKSFKDKYYQFNKLQNKKQYLTYYFIAAHPGCRKEDMVKVKKYVSSELKLNPEQVQIFTPLPSTYSTLMYYTEKDPFTGKSIFVEKDLIKKNKQKNILMKYK